MSVIVGTAHFRARPGKPRGDVNPSGLGGEQDSECERGDDKEEMIFIYSAK